VGKTSVVAGLISALGDWDWTAVKITPDGHGICSARGNACNCATPDHSWEISEERDRSKDSDSSRFLLAGARQSLWVRTQQGDLEQVMPALRARLATAGNVIIESNSVARYLQPDLYLAILDFTVADFKKSSRELLDRAGGFVVRESAAPPKWQNIALEATSSKPIFRIQPPLYVTSELIDFVRSRSLSQHQATRP